MISVGQKVNKVEKIDMENINHSYETQLERNMYVDKVIAIYINKNYYY